jgi:hypothetical protein
MDSSIDSEEDMVAYQLRNRHIPTLGDFSHKLNSLGLNPFPPTIGKGRGRRSNLSKAQTKVAMDMEAGRQLSITGALRAV